MQVPDPLRSARLTEAWFERHQRPLPWRTSYDPYQVLLSEVMLQQTRMEVVLPYFERFVQLFPSLADLAAASEEDVTAAWSGLGYYRRARMLRATAIEVMSRHGGTIPSTVATLRTLPGIGRYTAGAIASVAYDRRAPIVDGNVARIVARLFAIEATPGTAAFENAAWAYATALVEAASSPRNFNQGLMEVGALICTPRNPSCLLCPLRDECSANRSGRVAELPRAKKRKPAVEMSIPLYLIVDGSGRILMRREAGPLMHAMLHLPHGSGALFTRPIEVDAGETVGAFTHSITTRRVAFTVHRAALPPRVADRDDLVWIDPSSLASHPHPSYVRKALRLAGLV